MKTFSDFCVAFLKGYQWILSPLFQSLGVQCRFIPSCSEYAIGAVRTHGALKGIALGVGRLLRCHPFCKGGHDPVPGRGSHKIQNHCLECSNG